MVKGNRHFARNILAKSQAEQKKDLEELKKILETSAQTNRNLFTAFIFMLITALVLCLNISDEELLTIATSAIKLPALNVSLPTWAFACIGPLVIVTLHFDLLHNLTEHRNKLNAWCSCWLKVNSTANGSNDMPQQLYPFLFDFAWLLANHPDRTSKHTQLLPGLCWLLYCWAPYTILVVFFIRFADLQHYGYTGWHLLILIIDAWVLHWYWPCFTQEPKTPVWFKTFIAISIAPLWYVPYLGVKALNWLKITRPQSLWLSIIAAAWKKVLVAFLQMLFAFLQTPVNFGILPSIVKLASKWERTSSINLNQDQNPVDGLKLARPQLLLFWLSNIATIWTLTLFMVIQFHIDYGTSPSVVKQALSWEKNIHNWVSLDLVPHLSLARFRLTLPNDFLTVAKLQHPGKEDTEHWQGAHDVLVLSGSHLAFADLESAQIPHVNLSSAQLQNANLTAADLQGADLTGAQLQGVNPKRAQLQSAILESAHLEGIDFTAAQLQGVNLKSAQLQGANLERAQLDGAYLNETHLEGANLQFAKLQGAYLGSAYLQGADFAAADLNATILTNTRIKGIELSNVKNFDLSWAKELDWQEYYDFTNLENASWAHSKTIQRQIKQARQRVESCGLSKQLPASADEQILVNNWLSLLCKESHATKAMLKQLNLTSHPIDLNQVKEYLSSHDECKPFRNIESSF